MYIKFKPTFNKEEDTFRIELLLVPSLLLALLINADFTFIEILWTFSIYLEAVAILPQLFMLQRRGEAETITAHYLFALGSYRGLYILNWIYRYMTEGYFDPASSFSVTRLFRLILDCNRCRHCPDRSVRRFLLPVRDQSGQGEPKTGVANLNSVACRHPRPILFIQSSYFPRSGSLI
jgi:hypothetical protein